MIPLLPSSTMNQANLMRKVVDSNYEKGFTLLEILVALAMFAILATLTSSIMYYAFNTRARVTEQAQRLVTLQLALTLIQRDTEQVINRPVRGNDRQLFPAFIGQASYFELTRGGLVNPDNSAKQSTLKRVAILCRNQKLIRRTWLALDTVNRSQFEDKVLIGPIQKCQFEYLDQNLQILQEWRENAVQQNQKPEPFPKAIKLSFSIKEWGDFSQLFILPQALYVENS